MKKKIINKTFKNNKEYFEFVGKNQNIKVIKVIMTPEKIKISYTR